VESLSLKVETEPEPKFGFEEPLQTLTEDLEGDP
jgi:hypothetical protein